MIAAGMALICFGGTLHGSNRDLAHSLAALHEPLTGEMRHSQLQSYAGMVLTRGKDDLLKPTDWRSFQRRCLYC